MTPPPHPPSNTRTRPAAGAKRGRRPPVQDPSGAHGSQLTERYALSSPPILLKLVVFPGRCNRVPQKPQGPNHETRNRQGLEPIESGYAAQKNEGQAEGEKQEGPFHKALPPLAQGPDGSPGEGGIRDQLPCLFTGTRSMSVRRLRARPSAVELSSVGWYWP